MSQPQMDAPPLSEEELNEIYNWVDTVPLSRPKKHISRDFADGVLMAEIVKHYVPHLVELHNYSQAHSLQQKQYNWATLNAKVFRKMGFQMTQNDTDAVINCVGEAVERVLRVVQVKLQVYLESQKHNPQPAANQSIDVGRKQPPQKVRMRIPIKQQIKHPNEIQYQQYHQPQQNHQNNEKDLIIQDQRETIEILELKIQKLEQLVKLKDSKIQTLSTKLQQAGIR